MARWTWPSRTRAWDRSSTAREWAEAVAAKASSTTRRRFRPSSRTTSKIKYSRTMTMTLESGAMYLTFQKLRCQLRTSWRSSTSYYLVSEPWLQPSLPLLRVRPLYQRHNWPSASCNSWHRSRSSAGSGLYTGDGSLFRELWTMTTISRGVAELWEECQPEDNRWTSLTEVWTKWTTGKGSRDKWTRTSSSTNNSNFRTTAMANTLWSEQQEVIVCSRRRSYTTEDY